MVPSTRTGIAFAFTCQIILGAMPILSNARPAGSDGLAFAFWLTVWQLAAALPLFVAERRRDRKKPETDAPRGRATSFLCGTSWKSR